MAMNKERSIRAYVNLPTRMGASITQTLIIKNVSLSGCLLVTNMQISMDTPILLKVGMADGRELQLQGVVVRKHDVPHGYGISFKELTEEERQELALLIAESKEVSSLEPGS
jgi:hypothetical protein